MSSRSYAFYGSIHEISWGSIPPQLRNFGLGGLLFHSTNKPLLYESSSLRWRLCEGGSEIVPEAEEAAGALCMEAGQEKLETGSRKQIRRINAQENVGITLYAPGSSKVK